MSFPRICLRDLSVAPGKSNLPELEILSAIAAGAQTIGLSYAAATSFSLPSGSEEKATLSFRNEIAALAERYREKITVLLGERRDFYVDPVFKFCDYRIGSVRFVLADDGAICPLDMGEKRIRKDMDAHFGGNGYALARRYYETVGLLVRKTRCNYVAGFDLLQKINGACRLFDPTLPEYRAAVLDAMESLVREDVAFEIGFSKTREARFSPSPDIVRWLAAHGARFYLSPNLLQNGEPTDGFSECVRYAKSCGAGGFSYYVKGEWKTIPAVGKS